MVLLLPDIWEAAEAETPACTVRTRLLAKAALALLPEPALPKALAAGPLWRAGRCVLTAAAEETTAAAALLLLLPWLTPPNSGLPGMAGDIAGRRVDGAVPLGVLAAAAAAAAKAAEPAASCRGGFTATMPPILVPPTPALASRAGLMPSLAATACSCAAAEDRAATASLAVMAGALAAAAGAAEGIAA